ncbi:MAG: RdgB/HAM1 family non-canonical purine NTP pyrophosphatase, partial [Proteobacteria bacterium]|nr:RdgB/HAM1 family non-canonical purine NTP pyrophosphatase [Pseudomonadota bacterium]
GRILAGLGVTLLTPADLAAPPEVVEDGLTFTANAIKKARAFARAGGLPALADDSGLCVDALDGRPGVFSARYGGPDADDAARCRLLLAEMADVPEGWRQAAFVCVAALCRPDGECLSFEGRCEGEIAREPAGQNGFGYDPVFFVPGYNQTMAQLPLETKNRISHRGRAMAAMRDQLAALVK